MSNLAKLIQMQKAKTNAQADATGSADSGAGENAPKPEAQDDSESQPQLPADTPAPTASEDSVPVKKGLGLNLLRAGGVQTNPQSKPVPSAPAKKAPALDESFSLDDLAALDAGHIEPVSDPIGSGFVDEIEATAPDRDLPADLTASQLDFVSQLDGVYQVLNDPDMFAQSVRVIMMELQENREYIKLVSDQDVHTMIRGMRNSMGLALIRKQEKSRKTGGATKAKARKTSAELDSALSLLNDLGFGDD